MYINKCIICIVTLTAWTLSARTGRCEARVHNVESRKKIITTKMDGKSDDKGGNSNAKIPELSSFLFHSPSFLTSLLANAYIPSLFA